MKQLIISLVIASLSLTTYSQNTVETILSDIEKNNVGLQAMRSKIESEKSQILSTNNLDNPELSMNVLQASPSEIGGRIDMSITQSFDFPTTYLQRKAKNNISIEQLELEYEQYKFDLKKQVYLLCIELSYNQQLYSAYSERIELADSILTSFEVMFENREITVLEYNKAFLYKTELVAEQTKIKTTIQNSVISLQSINNGKIISADKLELFEFVEIASFDVWLQNYQSQVPYFTQLQKESDKSGYNLRLSKAERLPSFTVGYMVEQGENDAFRGLTAGVSIPLWESKHKVKSAQLYNEYVNFYAQNESLIYTEVLRSQFNTYTSYFELYTSYTQNVAQYSNVRLLQTSFENKQITFTEYLIQLDGFYKYYEQELNILRAAYISFVGLYIYM